jgi:hypothetical protein
VKCKKWRRLPNVADTSLIPANWTCEMKGVQCGKGRSVKVDNVTDYVEFPLGSVVWAKMKGHPRWPALIDYCPDAQEYYWDYNDKNEVTHYNVTFLDIPVSRSWILPKDISSITSPVDMKDFPATKISKPKKKAKLREVIQMANQCMGLLKEERLEKFSFYALFKGRWHNYSDIEGSDEDNQDKGHSNNKLKTKPTKNQKRNKRTSSLLKRIEENESFPIKLKQEQLWNV